MSNRTPRTYGRRQSRRRSTLQYWFSRDEGRTEGACIMRGVGGRGFAECRVRSLYQSQDRVREENMISWM